MWFGFISAVNFCHFSTLLTLSFRRCDINFTEVRSIFLFNIHYNFLHVILHPLSLPACPLFEHRNSVIAHPILSLPRNDAFTIKTSASYPEKSLRTSKLLISTLEIHRHFVAFNCLPFCLLFYKPTLTVSFGKY